MFKFKRKKSTSPNYTAYTLSALIAIGVLTGAFFGYQVFFNASHVGKATRIEKVSAEEISKYLQDPNSLKADEHGNYQLTTEQLAEVKQKRMEERVEQFGGKVKAEEATKKAVENAKYDSKHSQAFVSVAEGGTLKTDSLQVTLPKGAVEDAVVVTYDTLPSKQKDSASQLNKKFSLKARDIYTNNVSKFNQDLNIEIKLSENDLAQEKVASSKLYFFNELTRKWEALESSFNGDKGTVSAKTNHFTTFTVSAEEPTEEEEEYRFADCGVVIDDSFAKDDDGEAPHREDCFWSDEIWWEESENGVLSSVKYANTVLASAYWVPDYENLEGKIKVYATVPEIPEIFRDNPDNKYTTEAVYFVYDSTGYHRAVVDMTENIGGPVEIGEYEFNGEHAEVDIWGFVYDPETEENTYVVADAVCFGECPPGFGDLTPPTIEDAIATCVNGTMTVQAKITDGGSGVAQASVYLNGVEYPMTAEGDVYAAQAPCVPGATLNYYIVAYDSSGNRAIWSPTRGYISRGSLGFDLGVPDWVWLARKNQGNRYSPAVPGTGLPGCQSVFCADPINTTNGNLYEELYLVKVMGKAPIDLKLSYNSLGTNLTIFGENWIHNYNYHLNSMDNALFEGAFVTYPDGREVTFTGSDLTPDAGIFDSLKKDGDGYVLTLEDQTKVYFDEFGDVARIEDINGNALKFEYEGQQKFINLSKLKTIEADGGRKVEFGYNDKGLVSEVKAPAGKTLKFEYSDTDDLVKFVDADGKTTIFEYDGQHNILKKVSPNGHPLYVNTFDDQHRVIKQVAGDGFVQEYTYEVISNGVESPQAGKTTVKDGNGTVALYSSNNGTLTSVLDETNEDSKYSYDEDRNMTSFVDPDGKKTEYDYDEDGNQTLVKDALGQESKRKFNDFNKPTEESINGDSFKFKYEYDDNGNLTKITNPAGSVATFEYNSDGLVTESVDYEGNKTKYEYNSHGNLTEITSVMDDQGDIKTKYEYDDLGRKVSETKPEGQKYTYAYDANDNLTKISGPQGYTLRFEYDANRHLVKEIDANGGETKYEYDGSENLTKITNQLGFETKVEYGDMNERLREIDPEGRVSEYKYNPVYEVVEVINAKGTASQIAEKLEYNDMRRVNRQVDAEGRVTTLEYDPLYRVVKETKDANGIKAETSYKYNSRGVVTEETDANGNKTSYTLDGLDRIKETKDAEDNVTKYSYDKNNNLTKITDPKGNETRYEYDELNRLVKITDANEGEIKKEYDKNSNTVKETDQNGTTIVYKYDELDRVIEKQENHKDGGASSDTNVTTKYEYDLHGNLTKMVDPKGFETKFSYDKAHRNVKVTDAHGKETKYEYDKVNNLTKVTDRNGNTTTNSYDELNRLVTELTAENQKTIYRYDKVGNVVTMTDPKGFSTKLEYDGLDRLGKAIDPLNGIKAFDYDKLTNVTKRTDENGHAYSYMYDKIYRQTEILNPEGHKNSFDYDQNSNLVKQIDAKGNTTQYSYDKLNRLTEKVDALNGKYKYSYDKVGNILTETDENGHATKFELDGMYRIRKVTDAEGNETRFEYDANGNTVKLIDGNGHATAYDYDKLNRVIKELNAENETQGYAYDNEGNLTAKTAPDGIKEKYNFDKVYRLIEVIQNQRDGDGEAADVNVDTEYTYDPNNNLVEIVNANNNATKFEYDQLNRQIKEIDAENNVWNYSYDKVGNKTRRVDANGNVTNYSYFPDNQLRNVNYQGGTAINYQYDPNNNRVNMSDSIGTTTWDIDALNRIAKVNDALNQTLEYTYDAVGNRTGLKYPDGKQVGYNYYKNNWMKSMTDPDEGKISYSRDGVGNTKEVFNPNKTKSTLSYDKVDRITQITNTSAGGVNSAFKYTYNNAGFRTKVEADYDWRQPGKVTTDYQYDALRRLTASKDSQDILAEYVYDRVGNRLSYKTNDVGTSSRPYDSYQAEYSYNKINQVLSILEAGKAKKGQEKPQNENTSQPLYALKHEVEAQAGKHIDQVTADALIAKLNAVLADLETQQNPDATTIEAALNEIKADIEAARTAGKIDSDGIKNSLVTKLDKAIAVNGGKSGDNYLQAIIFNYDKNGNRIRKEFAGPPGPKVQGETYAYDPENRLASVLKYQGNQQGGVVERGLTSMQYDGAGRRLIKSFDPKQGGGGAKTQHYTYDNLDPVRSKIVQNGQYSNLYRGDMNRIALAQDFPAGKAGQKYWYSYDALGSVVGLTKQNGQSDHNYRYGDYGQIEPQSGESGNTSGGNFTAPHNSFTYTGQEWDEHADIYEFYSRAYDPEVGTWLQQDIYRGELPDPMSLHRYMYVNDSPVNYNDPYGQCPWCIGIGVVAGVGFFLSMTEPVYAPGVETAESQYTSYYLENKDDCVTDEGYNRCKAAEYAAEYGSEKRNPDYADYGGSNWAGGNCTNFVSQVLNAGGLKQLTNNQYDSSWYYRSDGDRTASWTGVSYLYNHMQYWSDRGERFRRVEDPRELEMGDVISIWHDGEGGGGYHTLVVSDIDENNIYVASNTSSYNHEPLLGPGGKLEQLDPTKDLRYFKVR